jgi:hypothetical protein
MAGETADDISLGRIGVPGRTFVCTVSEGARRGVNVKAATTDGESFRTARVLLALPGFPPSEDARAWLVDHGGVKKNDAASSS